MATARDSTWNLQDAKARLSELVDRAQAGKPQVILRRGSPAAAIVSISEYEALRPRKPLVSFLLESPLRGSGIEITRAGELYEPPTDLFAADD
jgi:prevent-host-death family protein